MPCRLDHSNFRVGAALLTSTNSIVPGANVENASYGAGICAERTALVKAMTQQPSSSNSLQDAHERPSVIAIAVASDLPSSPCSPCGICRQFIREFCALSMPVYMVWNEWDGAAAADDDDEIATKGVLVKTLEELLPLSFGPEHLNG